MREGRAALGGGLEVERSNRAPCFALDLDEQLKVHPASPASTRARTASAAVVNSAALRTWTSCSSDTAARPPSASRKIATRVATPARLRAMAARERHVGRIVGRAGAALQLGDCRATGRGHLAHKGHTDARLLRLAPYIALPVGHDNSRGKKVNIHKRFWLSTLVFFRLARRTNIKGRDAACAPARLFIFARWRCGRGNPRPAVVIEQQGEDAIAETLWTERSSLFAAGAEPGIAARDTLDKGAMSRVSDSGHWGGVG